MFDQTELLADGLFTVAECGEFLRLSRSTIYKAMESGQLVFVRFGAARRIPKRAAIAWAAANMMGGWASPAPKNG